MAIPMAKFEQFINAAIDKTKSGVLTWNRASSTETKLSKDYDPARSFLCSYAGGTLLLAQNIGSGKPDCFIAPDMKLPFQIITSKDDSFTGHILRLYNIVYNSFPSVESFMDAMINTADNSKVIPIRE